MTATTRIRWHAGAKADITAWLGYAGTVNAPLFSILRPVPCASDLLGGPYDEWALTAAFPGAAGKARYGGGPDDLKAQAERWLEEYVASLGAVFRDEPAATSEDGGTCPALACSHLWSLHGPGGCTGKVFPARSLTGEPCRCERRARL